MPAVSSGPAESATTILLIVPHGVLRVLLREWLAAHLPSYRFEHVSIESEARSRFSTHPPRVALVDAGGGLKAALRALENLLGWAPRTRVIMLIDGDLPSCSDLFREHGASACVSIRSRFDLVAAIEKAVKESASS